MSEDGASQEADVLERVRCTVRALINDGVKTPTISYALSFIATELGLCVADEPTSVFPVVLHGVVSAASQFSARSKSKTAVAEKAPADATLH